MSKKTLLVLGNGFDLNCNLASSFADFFNKIKHDVAKQLLDNQYNCNIWYLLFYYAYEMKEEPNSNIVKSKDYEGIAYQGRPFITPFQRNDPLWMEIETFIKRMLFGSPAPSECLYLNNQTYYNFFIHLDSYKVEEFERIRGNSEQNCIMKTFYVRNSHPRLYSIDYFLKELQEFENDFAKYLSSIANYDYPYECERLFDAIVGAECNPEDVFILSFNYTKADLRDYKKNAKIQRINIHGRIADENIIIGYDSSDKTLKSTDKRILFSKSGQKIFRKSNVIPLPKKDNVSKIVFYGHSLGQQDYAYFHAMFDKYDIYNSDIVLEFCYSEHGKNPEKMKVEYFSGVYALLNDYAQRSGKENEFKTILTRLQIENRLLITEVNK